MGTNNKQLKTSNINNYLSQIDNCSGPYTIIKIKCGAANCYMKNGSKKNLIKAIGLYNEAYDILSKHRGSQDPRALNVLLFIIKCENKLEKLKANIATFKKERR